MQQGYQDDPDVNLMLQVKAGDRNAFEQLVVRHQKSVINAVYRYTGNPGVAEDLAQEVFLRVFRAAPGYEPGARFTTWLFTIVRNLCTNYRSREGRYDRQMEPEMDPLPAGSENGNPERAAMQQQMRRRIRKAVSELPDSLRLPLILSYFNQLGYEEIARVLDLSVAAVKVRVHRGKLLLARTLMPDESLVTVESPGGSNE